MEGTISWSWRLSSFNIWILTPACPFLICIKVHGSYDFKVLLTILGLNLCIEKKKQFHNKLYKFSEFYFLNLSLPFSLDVSKHKQQSLLCNRTFILSFQFIIETNEMEVTERVNLSIQEKFFFFLVSMTHSLRQKQYKLKVFSAIWY